MEAFATYQSRLNHTVAGRNQTMLFPTHEALVSQTMGHAIVVDSREREPLPFPADAVTTRASLAVGDYSLATFEAEIAVERKSRDDAVHCATADRDRFADQLRSLGALPFGFLVIEGSVDDVWNHRYRSRAPPTIVLASLFSLAVDYRVTGPIFVGDDRDRAGEVVARLLRRGALHRLRTRLERAHRRQSSSDLPRSLGA
jgi:ERCC4-type nuclease